MKKYIHESREKFYPSVEQQIYCGVTIKDGLPVFNFQKDTNKDVISLKADCSGEYDSDNVTYVYAYEYNTRARAQDKEAFRNYLKGKIVPDVWYKEDVEDFVWNGVLKFDTYVDIKTIDVLVEVQPTKSPALTDLIKFYFEDVVNSGVVYFSLIKKAYADVEFDRWKAYNALIAAGYNDAEATGHVEFTERKFAQLKETGELFQIKRFIPSVIREGFLNYLKFKTKEEKKLYESLQGVNVLIYDDFITSGSTVKEVVRYLRAIHDKNNLFVFILVKQN